MLEVLVNLALNFVLIILPVSHVRVVMAENYIVGGAAGWGFVPTASYYSDWATGINFVPGDKLSKTCLFTLQSITFVNIPLSMTANYD